MWWEALKAAIIAVPKFLDAIEGLGKRLDAIAEASANARAQEIRNEQRYAAITLQLAKSDQDRAAMLVRLSQLEQRRT